MGKNGARLVAESVEMIMEEVVRIENYEWTPNEKIILKIANTLSLLGPSTTIGEEKLHNPFFYDNPSQ